MSAFHRNPDIAPFALWHCHLEPDSPPWRVKHMTRTRITFYITPVQKSMAAKLGIPVKEYANRYGRESLKTLKEEAGQLGIPLQEYFETLSPDEKGMRGLWVENNTHLETMATMTGKPLPDSYVGRQIGYIKEFISAHKPEVREQLHSLGLLKSKKEHLMVPRSGEVYEKLFSWFFHCIDRREGNFDLDEGFEPYSGHQYPGYLWPVLSLVISGSDSVSGTTTPFSFPIYYFPHFLKECISAGVDDFSGEKEPAVKLDICGETGHEVWETLFDGRKDYGELKNIPGFPRSDNGLIGKYVRECIDGCRKDLDSAIIKHAIFTCKSLKDIRNYPRLKSMGESILRGDVSGEDTIFIYDVMSLWQRMTSGKLDKDWSEV